MSNPSFPRVHTATPEEMAKAVDWSLRPSTHMAHALAVTGTPVCGGTVPPVTVAARREKNKRARAARRIQRRNAR